MPRLLKSLSKSLGVGAQDSMGTVVGTSKTSVFLSTARGQIEVFVPSPSQFSSGDTVRLKNGSIVGKMTASTNLTVFSV